MPLKKSEKENCLPVGGETIAIETDVGDGAGVDELVLLLDVLFADHQIPSADGGLFEFFIHEY